MNKVRAVQATEKVEACEPTQGQCVLCIWITVMRPGRHGEANYPPLLPQQWMLTGSMFGVPHRLACEGIIMQCYMARAGRPRGM